MTDVAGKTAFITGGASGLGFATARALDMNGGRLAIVHPTPPLRDAYADLGLLAELDARLAAVDRPIMLDFYADWCVSCKEMERYTFADPAVRAKLAGFTLLKADVTANTPEDKALLARFGLYGPPGIIFFAPGGKEIAGLRVVGFQEAGDFLKQLQRVAG